MGMVDTALVRGDELVTRAPSGAGRTMRAVTQARYGPTDVLELSEVDVPEIADDEVLVRVHAASIGAWVDHVVAGEPFAMRLQSGVRRPRGQIRASDVSGRVVAVGSKVVRFQPGDAVYGESRAAFAEYAPAGQIAVSHKPKGLSFEQAAATPIAGQTALLGLRDRGNLQPGQHVLIIGAAGGVGSFAVQIAKARGAEVTGVCSTDNVGLVESLGADHVIDYTERGLHAGADRYDVVLQLAGSQPVSELRRLLTPSGTLVLSSGEGGRWFGPLGRLAGAMLISPFVRQRVCTYVATSNAVNLAHLAGLVQGGHLTPVIDRTFPLNEMSDALRHFQRPHGRGKIVVTTGVADGTEPHDDEPRLVDLGEPM